MYRNDTAPRALIGAGAPLAAAQQHHTSEPQRVTEIPERAGQIGAALGELESQIDGLARSLEPVLKSADDRASSAMSGPPPAATQLGSQLTDFSTTVVRLSIRIADLRARLEV